MATKKAVTTSVQLDLLTQRRGELITELGEANTVPNIQKILNELHGLETTIEIMKKYDTKVEVKQNIVSSTN